LLRARRPWLRPRGRRRASEVEGRRLHVYTRAEAQQNADGTRDVSITGYWFQKDHDAIAERRVCKKCNDQSLHATVDDLMFALVHEPPPPLEGAEPRRPPPVTAVVEHETGPSRLLPIGLWAAGGVALVAGVIMIAIDEDPNAQGVQQERYRDTATGGVVLGLAGVAALGAGTYLWRRDRKTAPVAAVSSDGAYVGWAGTF
jgi:hypothetical protein